MTADEKIAELERELAAAKKEAQEGRFFRKVVEGSGDIISVIGPDLRARFVSDANRAVTGISPAEMLTLTLGEIFHPEDRARVLALAEELFASPPDRIVRAEFRRKTADGSWIHMETSARNLSADPDVGGIVTVGREVSDAVKRRAALGDSERMFRALFEGTSAAVTIRDVDTQAFLDCNPAALKLYGFATREELRGTTPDALSPPLQPDGRPTREVLREYVQRAKRDGVANMVWVARRRDGEEFPAEVRTTVIALEDGRRIMQTVIEDVTEERRHEKLLVDRAQRDELLGEVSRQFVRGSSESAVTFALQALGSFLGATRVRLRRFSADGETLATVAEWSLPGVPRFEFSSQDARTPFVRWIQQEVERAGFLAVPDTSKMAPEVLALAAKRPDPWMKAMLVVPVSQGEMMAWLVVDDVTRTHDFGGEDVHTARLVGEIVAVGLARAEAEARLRVRAARDELLREVSRRFLDGAPDAAIEATLERLGASLGLERASLFALDESSNRLRCTHRWHVRADVSSFESLESYPGPAAPGEGGAGEVTQAAAERWLLDLQRESGTHTLHALVGYGGRLFGLLTARARDGRAFTEDDATTLRMAGEVIAIGRARSAAESALARAKEEAVAASLAKSAFLANMSHELRTPLNGVIGMVDLLAGTPLDDRQHHYTEIARSSAKILLSVISDILDFSKIEAGMLALESIELDVDDVVEEVASILALGAEAKGLALSCESTVTTGAPLVGDPARLRQVLVNLLNNAVKFTRAGEVSVRASVASESADVARVRFTVRDTGVGIDPEAQRKLFQPFTQVDASTTRNHGGTGLGLAICRQIVERMGGEIGLTSTVDVGSTFWFEVPFAKSEGRRATQASKGARATNRHLLRDHPGEAADAPRTQGPRSHVLLVEDNPINAEVAGEILRSAGHTFDLARDGTQAIEAVKAKAYDLVLMDCQLPEVDGYEATARIRTLEADGSLPGRAGPLTIVALTASATKGDLDRCFAAGMNDHMSKPVDAERLLSVVARHRVAPAPPHHRPASQRAGAPAADLDRALERMRGDRALLQRIASQFASGAPEMRAKLRAGVEGRDTKAVAFATHRLRGQAATFGGEPLVLSCDALEAAAQRESWTAASAALLALEGELDRLLRTLAEAAHGA